jgi:hypothetical protein
VLRSGFSEQAKWIRWRRFALDAINRIATLGRIFPGRLFACAEIEFLWKNRHRREFARRRSSRHRGGIDDDQKRNRKNGVAQHDSRVVISDLELGISASDIFCGCHDMISFKNEREDDSEDSTQSGGASVIDAALAAANA